MRNTINDSSSKPRRGIFFGWFVLIGAVLIVSVAYSMRYSFAVFYKEILDEFKWSRAETAGAFSVSMVVYGFSSPFVGTLVDRLGPKKVLLFGMTLLALGLAGMSQLSSIWLMYVLYGFVMALGINSLGFAVHSAYVPNWFILKRGTALGIMMMGAGGANVLNAVYQGLLEKVPWRQMYLILAGLTVAIVVPIVAFIIRPTPQEMGLMPDGGEKNPSAETTKAANTAANALIVDKEWAAKAWTMASALRTPQLWYMTIAQLFMSAALNLAAAHQAIYCQDIGFDATFTASVLGLVGIMTIAGNFLSSVSDKIGREVTYTVSAVGTILSIYCLLTANLGAPWLLYAYAIIWGIFFGTGSPSLVAGLADMYGGRHFGAINGFFLLGFGLGGAIGPWLGGYIFDVTGSYYLAFILMMVAMVASTACCWLASPRKKRLVSGRVRRAAG